MRVKLIVVGKTAFQYLKEGEDISEKRLQHYCNYERIDIPDLKNLKNYSKEEIKRKESEIILPKLSNNDFVVLLDEHGNQSTSLEFASWIEKRMFQPQTIVFIIGGAFGFDKNLYERMNYKISLSKMTFSHQMVRMIFLEQLYRGFSILKGEPYHHP
jgi:23S rRNA (pseudouridine1915-N3)-methyltransferase